MWLIIFKEAILWPSRLFKVNTPLGSLKTYIKGNKILICLRDLLLYLPICGTKRLLLPSFTIIKYRFSLFKIIFDFVLMSSLYLLLEQLLFLLWWLFFIRSSIIYSQHWLGCWTASGHGRIHTSHISGISTTFLSRLNSHSNKLIGV